MILWNIQVMIKFMCNCTIFISDLHLTNNQPKTAQLFFDFLEHNLVDADALYILGDLVQFWLGDDDNSSFNLKIKEALKKASAKVPIFIMVGNRDFLLGEKFANESGCHLIPDPYVIDLYGRKTVLTHGDLLCSKDKRYLIFRKIIRFSFGIKLFLKLPIKIRLWVAQNMQKYSTKTKAKKDKKILAVVPQGVNNLLNNFNATQIIHGHVHIAESEEFTINTQKSRRISLGEWDSMANILVYYNNHYFEFLS